MNIFSYWHFHNASKEYFWSKKISNFMHRFKSAILAIFQFFQNGTFEPVHEIWNFFWPKVFFWSIMKMSIIKNIHNTSQGQPNPGFMQEKVQKGDFLKKPSWELKKYFCFRIIWITQTPKRVNKKWLLFLPFKSIVCDVQILSQKFTYSMYSNLSYFSNYLISQNT